MEKKLILETLATTVRLLNTTQPADGLWPSFRSKLPGLSQFSINSLKKSSLKKMTTLDEQSLLYRANRVSPCVFEGVFLYRSIFVCKCASLHVSLSLFPTLETYRINQKASRTKAAFDMKPEKTTLLQQRLQPRIIFN